MSFEILYDDETAPVNVVQQSKASIAVDILNMQLADALTANAELAEEIQSVRGAMSEVAKDMLTITEVMEVAEHAIINLREDNARLRAKLDEAQEEIGDLRLALQKAEQAESNAEVKQQIKVNGWNAVRPVDRDALKAKIEGVVAQMVARGYKINAVRVVPAT